MARRRRSRTSSDKLKGIILGLIGVGLFAALGGVWYFLSSAHVAIDSQTNCPKAGPAGIQVVLIDKSDPITPQQSQRVRQYIEELANSAKPGTRFDLYVADGDSKNVLKPTASVCSSGRGNQANPLYQNPTMVQRQFEERFLSVLRKAVDQLLTASTTDTSPILESIRAAAITSFGPATPDIPLDLTIVSDLVQHSALNSHFRGETNFDDLARKPAWRGLQASLKGAKVFCLYLLRPEAQVNRQPIQNRGHQLFWEKAIRASGGEIVFETI